MILSSAQAGFINRLLSVTSTVVPGVDPAAILATGATQIRVLFPADQVPGIIMGYMAGIQLVFALVTGTTGIAVIVSLFGDWKRLDSKAMEGVSGGVA